MAEKVPNVSTHIDSAAAKSASIEDSKILKATLQTCLGCQLKKSPHVKEFIDFDLPEFKNVTLEPKPKQSPLALFQNKFGQLVETIELAGKSRAECNQIFFNKGFTKKAQSGHKP